MATSLNLVLLPVRVDGLRKNEVMVMVVESTTGRKRGKHIGGQLVRKRVLILGKQGKRRTLLKAYERWVVSIAGATV